MPKLYLKFEQKTLKEFPLTKGVVTIGRLPDNDVQVDNLAVSGHHAKVYWESGHFVIEDNGSFNGTFINNQRILKQVLNDGDVILVGKHTLTFKDEGGEVAASSSSAPIMPPLPTMDATVGLDTKKVREFMAQAAAKVRPAAGAAGDLDAPEAQAPPPGKAHIGSLSVMSGKTDQRRYVLISKLNVIGKSDMASIKLKGWFAPKVAAAINRRDNKYFIVPSDKNQKVKVNGELIAGQRELSEGDMIGVARVTMTFTYGD